MVVVEIPNCAGETKHIYFDGKLRTELDKIKKKITRKDFDYVLIIDGEEGSGKSVVGMQICKYIDPTFDNHRIYFNGRSCHKGIINAPMKTAHQFDEAFTGLSSRTALSELNHLLNSMIMQMRQKNLFVCIVLPSIFILDKYPAMFRSRALIHVYIKHGRRGNYVVFNRKKKNELILKGKKDYGYHYVKSRFHGRFTDKYPLDEQLYRANKLKALQERPKDSRTDIFKQQRDVLLKEYHKTSKLGMKKISEMFKTYGVSLSHTQIQRILHDFDQRPDFMPSPRNIV